ncbi:MAG TPA: hypothetical protein VIH80_01840 [Steroidobacteraceae bacterium]|jgi:hypothetical protein
MAKRIYPLRIEPWSAVRIDTHGEACAKAMALRGKRFLGRDAPALPLKGCTLSAACHCSYRHYVDRRGGQRRSVAAGASRTADAAPERRSARERRGSG